MPNSPSYASRVRGCLLGLALGDALGARPAGPVAFSFRTQLALYTVDGLVELIDWANAGVGADETASLWLAYLRWLRAQGFPAEPSAPVPAPRWIDGQAGLQHRRDPDPGTVKALASGDMGTAARPVNTTAFSAAALVRCVPIGLIPHIGVDSVAALSRNAAALTHGHPGVPAAAAALGSMIHRITHDGADLTGVLGATDRLLSDSAQAAETAEGTPHAAIDAVLSAGETPGLTPADHFRAAMDLLAAHGPDPASAAALAGGILGARYGEECLPADSMAALEDAVLVLAVAAELIRTTGG